MLQTSHWQQQYPLYQFDQIDSTNLEAKRMIASGFIGNAVILANSQSGGKGRGDKIWISPPGNLYFTILLNKRIYIDIAGYLSYLTACAIGDVLLSISLRLDSVLLYKWPNDILIEQKKLAGVLLESKISNQQLDWLIIGIGINIDNFPNLLDNRSVSLRELNIECSPNDFLNRFMQEFVKQFANLENNGFANIRQKWLQRAKNLGKAMEVTLQGKKINGVFEDIDNFGNIILRKTGGQVKLISSGEVFFT